MFLFPKLTPDDEKVKSFAHTGSLKCQKYPQHWKQKSEVSEMFFGRLCHVPIILSFFFTSHTFKAFHILPAEFATSKGIISGSHSHTLMNFQRLEGKKKTGLPFLRDFWVIRLGSVRRVSWEVNFTVYFSPSPALSQTR